MLISFFLSVFALFHWIFLFSFKFKTGRGPILVPLWISLIISFIYPFLLPLLHRLGYKYFDVQSFSTINPGKPVAFPPHS